MRNAALGNPVEPSQIVGAFPRPTSPGKSNLQRQLQPPEASHDDVLPFKQYVPFQELALSLVAGGVALRFASHFRTLPTNG